MTGPTHVLSGLASAAVLGSAAGITPTAVELVVLVIGTLAPDIDGDGTITKPGKILRPFLGSSMGKLIDAVFGLFTGMVKVCFGHRGFIHAPLTAVAFFALGAAFERDRLTWFAIGYALHLFGDAVTAEGILLFSPFSAKRTSLSRIRTGSRAEGLIAFVLLPVAGYFGRHLLPDGVKATHPRLVEMITG